MSEQQAVICTCHPTFSHQGSPLEGPCQACSSDTFVCPTCGGNDDDLQMMCEACGGVGLLGSMEPAHDH